MTSKRAPVPLQQGLTYGPIDSKRLGRSLGINLSGSKRKLCNYNCVYCFYGPTVKPAAADEFPSVDNIVSVVKDTLKSDVDADWLTFSGNGESTIHPHFHEIVRLVREAVEDIRPGLRIALLSNGSAAGGEEFVETLQLIDLPILKLDAGDQKTFERINRPVMKSVKIEGFIENLHRISNEIRLTLQSVMFDGTPTNTRGEAHRNWLDAISYIKPDVLQLYTLDYAINSIHPIEPDVLSVIAGDIEKSGINVQVFLEVKV